MIVSFSKTPALPGLKSHAYISEKVGRYNISFIKGALNRQKSNFSRRISNLHKLRDLDQTFQALGKVAEAVVKGKYGPLRDRYQHEIGPISSTLERTMIRAKKGIYRRLSPRMSKIHPRMICFDVPMPQEVFN